MTPSAHCESLVRNFEGLSTKAYLDTGGVPTIGYGHTKGVKLGDVTTEAEALKTLKADLAAFGKAIDSRATADGVKLNQNEFDALTSFAFNLGASKLFGSTLWRKLRAGDHQGAADEFSRWNKVKVQDPRTKELSIITLDGLTRRRKAERALFLS